ncbi:ABC transporter ATP-binding protein [Actinokineospora auranticolor]|uniref:Putative ABC transport system ATP-binding protein n=1 Tax=Actinokineospora auranticolor TaxID=155976 RepID=A0A2S6H1J6_9PSEU|nr:ABC transporter ATP-binding protein [Actinokineospora auranticolor]PPK71355.1 putative ABC transport system ATP-binding protein [Actinokineospora auranticolor]
MSGAMGARGVLVRAVRRHLSRLVAGALLLSVHQAAEVAVPVAIGLVIDRAVATGDRTALAWSVVALAALFAVLFFAWQFGARQTLVALERETHLLRVAVAARVLDPRGHRTGLRTGELLSIAAFDAQRTGVVLRAFVVAVGSVVALVSAAVILLTIDLWLGIGVLVGVPGLAFATQAIAPLMTRRSGAQQEAAGRTAALATDLVGGLRVLRGIGAQHAAAARYRRSSETALAASLRAAGTSGLYEGVTTAAGGLFLAAVAGFAGWFALTGRLTVGELITVVGLAQFIAEPLRALGWCGGQVASARASAARLAEVFDADPDAAGGTRDVDTADGITVALKGVSYRTLQDVDLDLRPGELVGVLASDPRDADALVAVLAGRAAERTGDLLIGDVPDGELHLDARRRAVLVEQHDTALFAGTLRGNLTAGVHNGQLADPEEEVLRAVEAAAARDVVDAHPSGLDHPVTDRGRSLSGGQRQRIGLARALLSAAPVLVLHEPTTAVDAVTEERIAERLSGRRTGLTTLIVTSSPALLARADRVVVIEGGRVTRTGTHDELRAADETYRQVVTR